jgi:TonB family protein
MDRDPRLEVSDGSRAIHVTALWGETVLLVRHLRQDERLTVGSDPGADLPLPCPTVPLVEARDGRFYLFGEEPIARDARIRLELGGCTLQLDSVPPARKQRRPPLFDWSAQRFTAWSLGAHAILMLLVLAVPPAIGGLLAHDSFDLHQAFVRVDPPRPVDRPGVPLWLTRGGTGRRAKGVEGRMGDHRDRHDSGLFGVRGPEDNEQRHLARERNLPPVLPKPTLGLPSTAASWGKELATMVGRRIPSIVGDSTALGREAEHALGGLTGHHTGEAYGVGGLGIIGSGRGSGGTGETVGLGSFGTVGRGGMGRGGDGYGRGEGQLGSHRASVPRVSPCGGVSGSTGRSWRGCIRVRGSMDKEIIRRVIRRHINEVRYCYARELQVRPHLRGRVVVRFVILRTGMVSAAEVEASTLDSPEVERCVARAVRRWRFPSGGDGITIVSYPFVFQSAGDH